MCLDDGGGTYAYQYACGGVRGVYQQWYLTCFGDIETLQPIPQDQLSQVPPSFEYQPYSAKPGASYYALSNLLYTYTPQSFAIGPNSPAWWNTAAWTGTAAAPYGWTDLQAQAILPTAVGGLSAYSSSFALNTQASGWFYIGSQPMFYSDVYYNIGSSSVSATLTVGVDDSLFVFLNYNFIPGSGLGGTTAVCCLTATSFPVTLQPGRNVFHFFGRNVGGPGYVVWSLTVGGVVVARSDMNSRIGVYGAVKLQNGGFQQSTSFSNSPGWTFAGGGAASEYNSAPYNVWLQGMAALPSNAIIGAGLSIYAPDADTLWGVLQNKASMSTTYSNFVVGSTYTISFWATTRMCCTPNQVNDLGITISSIGSVFYNSAVGSAVYTSNAVWFWQPFMTSQFIATSTSHTITFTTTNPRAQPDVTTFVDDVRVVATSCTPLTGQYYMPRAEVFATQGYAHTFQQAEATCAAYNARVATTQEMYQAQRDGADWCSCSWVAEGIALYPITTSFYGGCGGFTIGVRSCGSTSWISGNLFAVACWGMKPAPSTAGILPFNTAYWNNPTAVDPTDPYYGVAHADTPGSDLQCKNYENGYSFEQCRAECDNNVLCNQVEDVAPNTIGNWGVLNPIPLTLTAVSSTFNFNSPTCCGGSLAIDGNGLASEWASAGEGVGAWISVSLTNGPAVVASLKIAPRQPGGGACDTVSGLSVQFSDGTTQALSFPCGSYPEGYQTFTVNKYTSTLKFTVTGVCGAPCNIGLSDIIAFAPPNSGGCCIKNYPVGTAPSSDIYGTWHAKTASCKNVGACTNAGPGQYYVATTLAFYASTCPVVTCSSSGLAAGTYFSGVTNAACTAGVSGCTPPSGLNFAAPGAVNAVWTSPGTPGNPNSCGWSCAPGYLQIGSACVIPPPPPNPPPPPPTDPALPIPYAVWSDPTTTQTSNFVLPPGVTYGSGAYTVATYANPGIVHYLGLNKAFSQQPCPGNTGFSFMFKMQLTNAATVNSIADGVSVCFMDATAASPASASLPAAWGQYGFASMHVPGMCFGVDTWYNVGNGGVGFAAWQTATAGDAGIISSAYAVPPTSNNLLPIIANGNAVEHQIDFNPTKQTLTWRIGGTVVLAAVPSAHLPSSFFVTWPVTCGGVCDTVQVSQVSMSCSAFPSPPPPSPPPPSPPPPSPPPPSPPPSPPPPSPPWAVIDGPAPSSSCFDVDTHWVDVDYPVQPFLPGTKAVPAGYTGVVTLKDRGTLGLDATLGGTSSYSEATSLLSMGTTGFVTIPAVTLGLKTAAVLGGPQIQNGFSIILNVTAPSPLPSTPLTVASFGNDASGASGATIRVTLTESQYALHYGTLPSLRTFNWTSTNGTPLPTVVAGGDARMLVRCLPGMTLCILGNY